MKNIVEISPEIGYNVIIKDIITQGMMKMKYNPEIHHSQSIRLKGFDYSGNAAYFITICTKNRKNFFGSVGARHWLALNEYGKIVEQCLLAIPLINENIVLDEFVIMPNHLHAIIIMNKPYVQSGRANVSPLREHHSKIKTIGYIIGQFKSSVTKAVQQNGLFEFAWQRNFYEHIIKNEVELYQIREYIINNPLNWDKDEYK